MEIIQKFFPNFSKEQYLLFSKLLPLYAEWNEKINVVSRKDIENIYERHVIHSLAIIKLKQFKQGTSFLDVGTGGGFPGIPLAIALPHCNFTLIDSIGKKITVVQEVVNSLGLTNVISRKQNVNELKDQFDYVVSRAVCAFPEFVKMTKKNVVKKNGRGIICLKGGDLSEELLSFKKMVEVLELKQWFPQEFFETKKLVFLPVV